MSNYKVKSKKISSFLFFSFLILTATSLQTTIWFSFFGYFPSPFFWTPIFVYLMMNREAPYNFLWLIGFYLIFLTQTSALPSVLFFTMMTLWVLILFFQKRFSTLSMADFIFVTSIVALLFPGIYFFYSHFAFPSPHIDVMMNFLSFVLTLPIVPPVLIVVQKIDSLLASQPKQDTFLMNL